MRQNSSPNPPMVERGTSWRLDGDAITLVFVAAGRDEIDLVYLGPRLPDGEDLSALVAAGTFGSHENEPDAPRIGGILPQANGGYRGRPAFRIRSGEQPVDGDFRLVNVRSGTADMTVRWVEQQTGLQVDTHWTIVDDRTIAVTVDLLADDKGAIVLESASSLSLPLPRHLSHMTAFHGRWAREMQAKTTRIGPQAIEMRSANGKPGFDAGNWLIFHGDDGQKDGGECLGIHASSCGDHLAHVVQDQDGRACLSIEALRQPGGIALNAGDTADLGQVTMILGDNRDHLTRLFHDHVRTHILPQRSDWGPRKVHLNSWEALAFDLDEAKLKTLATAAADLGIERFVLDDGWFKGRRRDNAGLGDWQVDEAIFPDGLTPLIDHVHGLDMDFGLWVEPEMVSPDSDLYRAHPEWCLHDDRADRPTERNQLVLDLSREDAFAYIHDALAALLENHDIAYLKWDHNRRLFPDNGLQQFAIQRLLGKLRQQYPAVEIESCSSGGGRVSFSMLQYCHRIWPSDNNDPIERLRIMESWARFLPLEILGNHVGPSPNPITGRRTDMDFRAKVALFGHMGVETNPAAMSEDERAILRAHIALYKQWRALLHQGDFRQLHHPETSIYGQMVIGDRRALAVAAQTAFAENFNVAPVRLPGLDADKIYHVTLPKPWPRKASAYLADPAAWESGMVLSGRALAERGLALPLTHPETAWLIAIEEKG
ncbi:MAG: alpha-galactosidase [Parasphingorhabdus sp.]|uniref:alpha-galactosidase n=1 Tax=Parasphingorhabdus sp. TaxID=2709688 RepID=UPI0032997A15